MQELPIQQRDPITCAITPPQSQRRKPGKKKTGAALSLSHPSIVAGVCALHYIYRTPTRRLSRFFFVRAVHMCHTVYNTQKRASPDFEEEMNIHTRVRGLSCNRFGFLFAG